MKIFNKYVSVSFLIIVLSFSCKKDSKQSVTVIDEGIFKDYKLLYTYSTCGLPGIKVTYRYEDFLMNVGPMKELDTIGSREFNASYKDSLYSYISTHPNIGDFDTLRFDWRLPTKDEATNHGMCNVDGIKSSVFIVKVY